MAVKEKLIEILRKPIFPHELVDPTEAVADYLIDSGVTVQEWVSVKDRLPEEGEDVLLFFGGKYGNMATGFWHGEEKEDCVWWCAYTDDGFYTDCDYKPTHWMPLPAPPKGE